MILQVLERLNTTMWGIIIPFLLLSCGSYLSFSTAFFHIREGKLILRNTIGTLVQKEKKNKNASAGISPFQAVSTALAGTVGTGCIAGVSTAIALGGAGAVFWMMLSAFFGMIIKYAEIMLSIKFRDKRKNGTPIGGPMYYILYGMRGKSLAMLFSFVAMFACMGTGNAVQSNSIAVSMKSLLNLSPIITGIIVAALTGIVIFGSVKRIAAMNEKLVPFMISLYFTCCLIVIFINYKKIPNVFCDIIGSAFAFDSLCGGACGYTVFMSIRHGFSYGLLSNEAGLGTAPIAHGASQEENAVKQGLWGIFEVFFTTILMGTLTALVILLSGMAEQSSDLGISLAERAFNSAIPHLGDVGVSLSVIFFALSSVMGWAFYGETAVCFLFGEKKHYLFLYRISYIIVILISSVISVNLVWEASLFLNALMSLPNLIAIWKLAPIVASATRDFVLENKKRREPHS